MDTNGFYGDTFSSGFGDFYTAKRGGVGAGAGAGAGLLEETPFSQSAKFYNTVPGAWQQHLVKVRPSLELEGANTHTTTQSSDHSYLGVSNYAVAV